MSFTYLDWAATAPPDPDILRESLSVAEVAFGNPSSIHAAGLSARRKVEEARSICGAALECPPQRLVFTSSATEANNIVLSSRLFRRKRGSVLISGIEHASVHQAARGLARFGYELRVAGAGRDGIVHPETVAEAIDVTTELVSVMHVNNETGAVQPLREICAAVRGRETRLGKRILIHCDAVQSLGRYPLRPEEIGLDAVSASGHKIGGLRGAGLLYLGRPFDVLYQGGGQEGGIRPGTENLLAIWSLARALEEWVANQEDRISIARDLRDKLRDGIDRIPRRVYPLDPPDRGDPEPSPYILCVAFPPIPGEVLVRVLSDAGFGVSTGSACSSRGKKDTRVLVGAGVPARVADSAIRISTGPGTEEGEILEFCNCLASSVRTLGKAAG